MSHVTYRAAAGALCLATALLASSASSIEPADGYDVTWNSLGKNYRDSMPIGNGDLGLNVWTESNGDIVFLIGKTDAWTENGQLVKLGRIRLRLSPNPFTKAGAFRQVLRPGLGEVELHGDSGTIVRVWVDANHPVAHVEVKSEQAMDLQASTELWRLQPRETLQNGAELTGTGVFRELNNLPEGKIVIDPDTILPARNHRLVWCHHNTRSIYPIVLQNQHLEALLEKYPDPLLQKTFGAAMKGAGLTSADDRTLKSARAQNSWRLDLYALTKNAPSPQVWATDMEKLVAETDRVDLENARAAHQQWWSAFWDRSWIRVTGAPEAEKVTQGYAMQRYMNACGGRGDMPIKYNGSIFTVGEETPSEKYDPAKGEKNADFRAWGGNLWFQNTRLIYWPMIASGDYDLLAPWFQMYSNNLPLTRDRTKLYFDHEGAGFPETIHFWGTPNNNDFGWGNKENIIKNTWIRHYVAGGLELTAMLLEAYDYTQDEAFAKSKLVPLADAVTTYYDEHWKRSLDGKIHLDPAQAIETNQQAVNPTPDLAGLKNVLPRLVALPQTLADDQQRSRWKKMLADLPPLPTGRTGPDGKQPLFGEDAPDGKPIILPAEKYSKPANVENAELYAVFPYFLYGVQLPNLELARNTYEARRFKSSTCWGQDGMQCAILGLTEAARTEVVANFTAYGGERFSWFWKQGHDWEPDMDNGGAGMSILQLMLLQSRGDKVLLTPAWPKSWDVDFKLHAPKQTILEGSYRDGRLVNLTVTPTSRAKDVIKVEPQ